MEKIMIDDGSREYDLGGGAVLRANFADPALYERFLGLQDTLSGILQDMQRNGQELGGTGTAQDGLGLLNEADARIKSALSDVFPGNDFAALFAGRSMLAGTGDGLLIHSLINAMMPLIERGVSAFARGGVAQAKANREQRRAAQKQ